MKLWNIKYIILFFFCSFSGAIFGQNRYEKRVEKYRSGWERLIPTHQKIQFAGGMGLLSFGIGWDYGKNNQWETDVFLGYLPKYSTKHGKATFTLKQNFIPWSKSISNTFSIEPLACGLYVNTIMDGDFWVSEPDKYPSDYYSFSTKMRFNVFIGQRFTLHVPPEKRFISKSITVFYEISTCDLYVVSAFGNKSLKPSDYLRLSFGLRFQVF